MQLEQHSPLKKVLAFNMRHVKYIEIIIWYLADTPLNRLKNVQIRPAVLPNRHTEGRTDIQRDVQTQISILYMIIDLIEETDEHSATIKPVPCL